jgi:glycosyltransferase involved in cell wall biosynthesis
MKVTGFSFIRNAVKYNYPVVEALQSILPLCDEVIVAVGNSDDGTRELVAAIDLKIRIIDTVWDDELRIGGKILAVETDKAFAAIDASTDWCIYIQGDEVLHEDGHQNVMDAMKKWKDDKNVDGLLFNYRHFYGAYDYVGSEGRWYRHEIRVIKNDNSIYSYRDAQGFRKGENEKLKVKPVDAYIHHYGWVQEPRIIKTKCIAKDKIMYDKQGDEQNVVVTEDYAFTLVNALEKFKGTHPKVMQPRIDKQYWKFVYDEKRNTLKFKDRFKNLVEKITGRRPFDYQNYKIV